MEILVAVKLKLAIDFHPLLPDGTGGEVNQIGGVAVAFEVGDFLEGTGDGLDEVGLAHGLANILRFNNEIPEARTV